jgi:hypothetical protein
MDIEGMVCWRRTLARPSRSADAAVPPPPGRGEDSGMNTSLKFQSFVYEVLQPVLQRYPGDRCVVVCDNASVHSVPGLRQYIEGLGLLPHFHTVSPRGFLPDTLIVRFCVWCMCKRCECLLVCPLHTGHTRHISTRSKMPSPRSSRRCSPVMISRHGY